MILEKSRRDSRSSAFLLLAVFLIIVGLILMALGWSALRPRQVWPAQSPTVTSSITPTLTPSATPEPLIPTRTPLVEKTTVSAATLTFTPMPILSPTATSLFTPTPTPSPTATPLPPVAAGTATATVTPAATRPAKTPTPTPTVSVVTLAPPATLLPASDFKVPASERFRLGVSLPGGVKGDLTRLQIGWVMDWGVRSTPNLPPGIMHMPTVRMRKAKLSPPAETLTAVAAARPGATWLISNEPDVRWQDNVDPLTYARLYHEAYTAIKAGDPTAIVAVGGISQPTPLRLRYLDLVLEAYRTEFGTALPAQAWHIHNYMLREERDSWGVDIPPGIADNTGILYGIDDSGNLDAFRSQIYAFRRWMAARGYGGQPLIISEFGVPMPEDYGFPPERMAEFLRETWRFFLTAADGSLGDPHDGGRLVQRWCWFSLADPVYNTGNLIDLKSSAWTYLGRVWLELVQ